jgi:hypothetical protein
MDIVGSEILNFIGGSIRWFFGTIFRLTFNKKKFTFHEYLYGPKNLNNDYNKMEHEFANKVIAFMFFFFLILLFAFFKII